MNGLLKFVVGGAVGTAVGLVVASLAAPKKGTEFQADVRQRLADSMAAGDENAGIKKPEKTERER